MIRSAAGCRFGCAVGCKFGGRCIGVIVIVLVEGALLLAAPHGMIGVQQKTREARGEILDELIRDSAQRNLDLYRQLPVVMFLQQKMKSIEFKIQLKKINLIDDTKKFKIQTIAELYWYITSLFL